MPKPFDVNQQLVSLLDETTDCRNLPRNGFSRLPQNKHPLVRVDRRSVPLATACRVDATGVQNIAGLPEMSWLRRAELC
jgi:hypothetical protein